MEKKNYLLHSEKDNAETILEMWFYGYNIELHEKCQLTAEDRSKKKKIKC